MTKQEKFESYLDSMNLDRYTTDAIKQINDTLFEGQFGRKRGIGGFAKPVDNVSLGDIIGGARESNKIQSDEQPLGLDFSLDELLDDGVADVSEKELADARRLEENNKWNRSHERQLALRWASQKSEYAGLFDNDGRKFTTNAFKVPFVYDYRTKKDCPEKYDNDYQYMWISGDKLPDWQEYVTNKYDMATANEYIADVDSISNVDELTDMIVDAWKEAGAPEYEGGNFAFGDGTGTATQDDGPKINIVKRKEVTEKENAVRWAVMSKMFDGYLRKEPVVGNQRRIPNYYTNGPMYKVPNLDDVTEGNKELPHLYLSKANLDLFMSENAEAVEAMSYKPVAISGSRFNKIAMEEWKAQGRPDYNSLVDMAAGGDASDDNLAERVINAMNTDTFDGWISHVDIATTDKGDFILDNKSNTYGQLSMICDYVKGHPECTHRYVATSDTITVPINDENVKVHVLLYIGDDIKSKGSIRGRRGGYAKIVGYFDDDFMKAGDDLGRLLGSSSMPNLIEGPILVMGAETEISSNVKLNNCTIINSKIDAGSIMNGVVIGKGAKLINSYISVEGGNVIQLSDRKTIGKTVIMGGVINNCQISGGYAEIEMSELENINLNSGSAKILSGVSLNGDNCHLNFTDGNAVVLKSRYNYKAGYEKDITKIVTDDGEREFHKKIWGTDENSTLEFNGEITFNTVNGTVYCTASVLNDVTLNGPCNVKLSNLTCATVGTEGSSDKTRVYGVECVGQSLGNPNEVIICSGATVGEDSIAQKGGVKLMGNVRIEGGTTIVKSNIESGSYIVSGMNMAGCHYGLTQPEAIEIANYLDKKSVIDGDLSTFDAAEERYIKGENKENAENAVKDVVNGNMGVSGWKSVPLSYVLNYMLDSLPVMSEMDKVNSVFMEPSSDGRMHYSERLYLSAWDKLCGICRFRLGTSKGGNEIYALGILVKRPNVELFPDKIDTRSARFREGKYDSSWRYQPDIEGFDALIYGYYLDGKINLRSLIKGLEDGGYTEAYKVNMEQPEVVQYFIVPCTGKFNGISTNDAGDCKLSPIGRTISRDDDVKLRYLNASLLENFANADTDTSSAMDRYSRGDVNNGGVRTAICKPNGEMIAYTYDNKVISYSAPKYNVVNGRMEVVYKKQSNDDRVEFLGTDVIPCAEDAGYREAYDNISDSAKKAHGGSAIVYAALHNQNPANKTTQKLGIDNPSDTGMPSDGEDAFMQSIMNKLRNVYRYQNKLYYKPFFNKKTETWKGIGILYDESKGGWRYYSPAHPAQLMKSPDSVMPTTINVNKGDELSPAKYKDMTDLGMIK